MTVHKDGSTSGRPFTPSRRDCAMLYSTTLTTDGSSYLDETLAGKNATSSTALQRRSP